MKNLITIGLPSKGRLKDKAVAFFNNRNLKVKETYVKTGNNTISRVGHKTFATL